VRIEAHLPSDRVAALVDVAQMTGVVVNLLLNALDAQPSGGKIDVALDRTDRGQLILTVTDTGTGIPEEIRGRLFEPFISTKDTGTGLGLNVCRRVVRDHGGDIRAENLATGGARFTIVFPEGLTRAETASH
jgi:signal transduction histidine kinase